MSEPENDASARRGAGAKGPGAKRQGRADGGVKGPAATSPQREVAVRAVREAAWRALEAKCDRRGGIAVLSQGTCLKSHLRAQDPKAGRELDECIVCPQGTKFKEEFETEFGAEELEAERNRADRVRCNFCGKHIYRPQIKAHVEECARRAALRREEAKVKTDASGMRGGAAPEEETMSKDKKGKRVKCEKCGREFGSQGIGMHAAACTGPKEEKPKRKYTRRQGAGRRKKAAPPAAFITHELEPIEITIEDVIEGLAVAETQALRYLRDAVLEELDSRS